MSGGLNKSHVLWRTQKNRVKYVYLHFNFYWCHFFFRARYWVLSHLNQNLRLFEHVTNIPLDYLWSMPQVHPGPKWRNPFIDLEVKIAMLLWVIQQPADLFKVLPDVPALVWYGLGRALQHRILFSADLHDGSGVGEEWGWVWIKRKVPPMVPSYSSVHLLILLTLTSFSPVFYGHFEESLAHRKGAWKERPFWWSITYSFLLFLCSTFKPSVYQGHIVGGSESAPTWSKCCESRLRTGQIPICLVISRFYVDLSHPPIFAVPPKMDK